MGTDLLPPRETGRSGQVRKILILVAAIAILAIIAGWLLFATPASDDSETGESQAAAESASGEQTQSGAETGLGKTGRLIRPGDDAGVEFGDGQDGSEARRMIAEIRDGKVDPDLAQLYARAEAFRDAGRPADAYLLYFFTAREGYAPSAMALGTMADPEYYALAGNPLEKPDLTQAYKWYMQAAVSGEPQAKARLDSLRGRVEEAASSGDMQARRLLLQWR